MSRSAVPGRLALGTVQFGLPYGVANRGGQVSRCEAAAILQQAAAAGLDTLDTAIAYGESEHRLGEIGVSKWRVITKLPPRRSEQTDSAAWVRQLVHGSLARLRISRLRAVLLHRSRDLLGPRGDELYAALLALKGSGEVEKIGVSIYNPAELDALPARIKLDLVQAPFNVLDRRLEFSGWLARLAQENVEIHVRSIFLQGLLLMDNGTRPARFAKWTTTWDRWQEWLGEQQVTPLRACLGFALSIPQVDRVVVGIDSVGHLREILDGVAAPVVIPPPDLVNEDPDLINPSRWNGL